MIDFPFSSLIDYNELLREQEQRSKALQTSQQKIMRTNAIGDALRVIIDAIGGSMGATITPKAINPAILSSYQRYNQLSDNLADLRLKEKDLQYNNLSKAFQAEMLAQEARIAEQERQWKSNESRLQREAEAKLQEQRNKAAIDLENTRNKNDIAEIQAKYAGEVEKIIKKSEQDMGKVGGFLVARYDDPTKLEPLNRETVIGLFEDFKKYLSSIGKTHYLYPVLTERNKGNISNDDLRKLIAEYPGFFGKRLPQLYGIMQTGSTQQSYPYLDKYLNLSKPKPATPYKQGTGPLRDYGSAPPYKASKKSSAAIRPDSSGITDVSEIFK